jgi:hypothetical protein
LAGPQPELRGEIIGAGGGRHCTKQDKSERKCFAIDRHGLTITFASATQPRFRGGADTPTRDVVGAASPSSHSFVRPM